eukprot:2131906-Rhodomonas_salina.3
MAGVYRYLVLQGICGTDGSWVGLEQASAVGDAKEAERLLAGIGGTAHTALFGTCGTTRVQRYQGHVVQLARV